MSSLKTTHPVFDQHSYTNTFYCCDNNHPFVAFTTCYCPLCEAEDTIHKLFEELGKVETSLDNLSETHENLVVKVSNHAPELLI